VPAIIPANRQNLWNRPEPDNQRASDQAVLDYIEHAREYISLRGDLNMSQKHVTELLNANLTFGDLRNLEIYSRNAIDERAQFRAGAEERKKLNEALGVYSIRNKPEQKPDPKRPLISDPKFNKTMTSIQIRQDIINILVSNFYKIFLSYSTTAMSMGMYFKPKPLKY